MYTPSQNIDRSRALANAMRQTPTGGHWAQALAHALSQGMAGHQDYKANQAELENDELKKQEMSQLAAVLGGGAAVPLQPGVMPKFSHPDVQEEALKQTLAGSQQPSPHGSVIWTKDAQGNPIPGFANNSGGFDLLTAPDGSSFMLPGAVAGYDDTSIARRGAAETAVEVDNINQTSTPAARAAAEEARAVGEVENQLEVQQTYTIKDIEREFERGAARKSLDYAVEQMQLLKEDAERLLNHEGLNAAFGFDSARSLWPGSAGADAKGILNTLKNKNFITALGAMREASKTGGAVGNVSNAEGGRFENALVALEQSQSDKQAREELQRLINIVDESINRMNGAFDEQYGRPILNQTAPETGNIPSPVTELPAPGRGNVLRFDENGNPV